MSYQRKVISKVKKKEAFIEGTRLSKFVLPGDLSPEESVIDLKNQIHGIKFQPSVERIQQAFYGASGSLRFPESHADRLIANCVHLAYAEESRCYYLTSTLNTYIRLLIQAKRHHFHRSYYFKEPGDTEVSSAVFQARLVNLMTSNRDSHKTEMVFSNRDGLQCTRSVGLIEAEISEFIEMSIDRTTCHRLSELSGQYLDTLRRCEGSLRQPVVKDPGVNEAFLKKGPPEVERQLKI
jgi:hypothetical protein